MDSASIAPPLCTPRLQLRRLRWGDGPFVWRLLGNASVRRYLGGVVPWRARLGVFRRYLRQGRAARVWVVLLQGRSVGMVFLEPRDGGSELSYQFIPAVWGQGIAGEAVGATLRHGVAWPVRAQTQGANARSCRFLERMGFEPVARQEEYGAEQVVYELRE